MGCSAPPTVEDVSRTNDPRECTEGEKVRIEEGGEPHQLHWTRRDLVVRDWERGEGERRRAGMESVMSPIREPDTRGGRGGPRRGGDAILVVFIGLCLGLGPKPLEKSFMGIK